MTETAPAISATMLAYDAKMAPVATEETDESDDEFEDAEEEHNGINKLNLEEAFVDCEVAIRKFFNNDVEGALEVMKPWSRVSLYHSLGMAIFEFIPAILTFDNGQIARALDALKVCLSISNKLRRNSTFVSSIGTMLKKPNYITYTDLEAHAELCHAEALLLQAALTIMEGEDLTGLIRGTLKVKRCYGSYKECSKIMEKKQWCSETSKVHFHSGMRLGIATFNLMISLLPPRIIALLEFVGFNGNKYWGLSELEAGSRAPGLRSVLCDLTLLAYHLVICHFIGGRGDHDICQEILDKELEVYPDGVWFLLFKGRLEFTRGNYDEALVMYQKSVDSQDMWQQFKHVCYWEMMWVNALKMDWREAASYASSLIEESNWSRTIYSYTKAALLIQLAENMTLADKQECEELMRKAPDYKQRIAGKSLPMEKFMAKRCARYYAQKGNLVLPGIELLYLWNMFDILSAKNSAPGMLKLIETTQDRLLRNNSWQSGYADDNRALVTFLHGCWLRAMRLPLMALQSLEAVLQMKNNITEDTFLLPYATVEIGLCYHLLGQPQMALQFLQDARKKYSGYSLESRLHFRIHTKIEMIKNEEGPTSSPRKPSQQAAGL